MNRFQCPRCETNSIPPKDKYKAGHWRIIFCRNCKAKLCAQPLLLAFGYIFYTWDVVFFGYLAYYERNLVPIIYMIAIWFALDFINIKLMPLSIMRSGN
ncbi:MAG: hypothetical protein ACE5EH_06025 [Gammaproteobacteria bacterium]